MGTAAAPLLNRSFPLKSKFLAPGSAASLVLGPRTTDALIQALLSDDGVLPPGDQPLANFDVQLAGGDLPQIKLGSAGSAISLGFRAEASVGLGVFDSQASLLTALDLTDAGELDLQLDAADTRFMLLRAGYEFTASASGSHPLGALGALSFGASGNRSRVFAVVNRISPETPARTALTNIAVSLRLPKQIEKIDDLDPGTIILAEAEGGFALSLAAQVGYDFSFIREIQSGGLSGDLGLRLETGLKASLGFEAGGRFLVTVDRPSMDASVKNVRVRLFKLAKRGWNFGFDLNVGVQGVVDAIPEQFDDLVKAVFGTHGDQVLADLAAIEKWTDPNQDLSQLAAGLTNDAAFRLIKSATGVDPATAFNEGREQLLGALRAYKALPGELAAQLQSILQRAGLSATERKRFEGALTVLAADSDEERQSLVEQLVSQAGFDSTPIGQWLRAAATDGLMTALDNTAILRKPAQQTLALLNGQVFEKALQFISDALNLDQIESAVTKTDFNKIDSWLQTRISNFLDEKFAFEKLDDVKNAINRMVQKRQQIYAAARAALAKRYDFSYAYEYQSATAKTALLDVTFNMAQPPARNQLKAVLQDGNYNEVFVQETPGVTLGRAVMTHQLSRKSRIAINMPFWQKEQSNFLQSDASVEAIDDGGRVLVYEVKTDNKVEVANRMRSQLSIAAGVNLRLSGVRQYEGAGGTWSYQFREGRQGITAREFERRVGPFLQTYFPKSFGAPGQGSVSDWVAELDRRVETVNGASPNLIGNALVSVDLSLPNAALGAWFQKFGSAQERKLAKLAVSRRLQEALKYLIPFGYLQNLDNLQRNDALGALLVWASIPPSTAVKIKSGKVLFNQESGVYWDWPSAAQRAAIVASVETRTALAVQMRDIHDRLADAGRTSRAAFFVPTVGNVEALLTLVDADPGPVKLQSLLRFEAQMVTKAADALDDMAAFHDNAATLPAKAIAALAEYGADLTDTFNRRLKPLYGGDAARPLGSMLFLEATRALNPDLVSVLPSALFTLAILKTAATFDPAAFLAGAAPAQADVAINERIVSTGAAATPAVPS